MCGNTGLQGAGTYPQLLRGRVQGTPCTGHHSVEITTKDSVEALEEVAEFTQKGPWI